MAKSIHNYYITAEYSAQGCKELLRKGGEQRMRYLQDTYGYLNLTIQQYFWLNAGKKIILVVSCEDHHAAAALGALKMQLFTSGLYEYVHMERVYTSEDMDAIKNVAKVIE